MKPIFKLALGLFALSLTQQASAATIRLTGSTAFRGGVHKAIVNMMGGAASCKFATAMIPTVANPTGATVATQAGYEGADYSAIQGTIAGIGGTSTVYCTWTGSATGIADVSADTLLAYIPAASIPGSTGYGAAAITQTPTPGAFAATIAFSDAFIAATPTPTADLADNIVAVIPFTWVANRLSTGFTNMTAQGARALFTAGFQPKRIFTGVPTDTDYVLPVGRDNGSGTRITTLAEIKYGVNTPVQQWKIVTSGAAGSGTVTSAQLWPQNDGVGATSPGNGGYSSGSNIRGILGFSSTSGVTLLDETGAEAATDLAVTLVSCIGVSDAATAIGTNAVRLAYDGVTYDGTDANLIYHGRYTMWGYLHLYTKPSPTMDEGTFRDNVATQLDNTTVLGSNGLRDSQMLVGRASDGAVVGP